MPLYEYKCNECGLRFERRQSFSDPAVDTCPECGGEVVRLIQPPGIIFKGSGFYVTDNRAKSSTATPGTRQDSTETESSASSAKKETSASDKSDKTT